MKKLIYLIFLLTILLIPGMNVHALALDSVRIYYYDDSGQLLNNGNTINDNWGGSQAYFNNIGFTVGSFQDIPASVYAFFPSGLGCANTSCLLQGEIISNESTINTTSYTPLDDVEINVEANGHYTRCSVIGRYRQYDRFTHVTFQCSVSDLNNGFNVNYSNMGVTAGRYTYFGVVPSAFTITTNLSTQDIIISDNANTNNIINNNNSNTQNIINNQDSNTQDIIDNQNDNTQDIIDNQNSNTQQQIESQKVCTSYDKGSVKHSSKILDNNGELVVASASWGVTDFIPITKNYSMQIKQNYSGTSNAYLCFYDDTKTKISCQLEQNIPINTDVTIPNNASFFRYSIVIFSNVPQLEICSNGNQALNDSLNDLNSNIISDNVDDPSSTFSEFQNMLATNGVITQLITLPISLFQKILDSLNASCSNFSLGTLYNHELVLPCINVANYVGSSLWTVIDVLFSGFFVLVIAKKMIATFENFSSMKEGDVLD